MEVYLNVMCFHHLWSRTASNCDVILDTPSYNHGCSAAEALFARVPLVHMPGPSHKITARSAGSALRAAGLYNELATQSWAEYVDKAVELAVNTTTSRRVRAKLHAMVFEDSKVSVLFRPEVDVAALFSGLREAYRGWMQGSKPKTIFTHPLAMRNRVTDADYAEWFGNDSAPSFEFVHEQGRVYPRVKT